MKRHRRNQNEKCYIFTDVAPRAAERDFNRVNIFILRHGIAVERRTPGFKNDFKRPLTSKGERQLRKTAVAMQKMGLRFDLLLSSPYERAKRTAEIIADKLKLKKLLKFSDNLTSEGNAKKLIRQLNELKPVPDNVLLVGHEPYLSELISTLTTGDMKLEMDFEKGGLCKLKVEKLYFGSCATLASLLTPKQMKLMR
jgi:phosphohistidine phosphatase